MTSTNLGEGSGLSVADEATAADPSPAAVAHSLRCRKAVEIIDDPQHPQHGPMMNLIETALALDPPEGWPALVARHPSSGQARLTPAMPLAADDSDPTPAHGIPRPKARLTLVLS